MKFTLRYFRGVKNCAIMKKRTFLLLLAALLVVPTLISGSHKNKEPFPKSEHDLRNSCSVRSFDDGWTYCFSYQYFVPERSTEGRYPYLFNVINMKYRYDEKIMEDPNAVQPQEAMQYYSEKFSDPGIASDMRKIGELLGYEMDVPPTKKELLAIDKNSITFEKIDKDMFFEMMEEALTAEYVREEKYSDYPSYAFLHEPAWLNDYRFQIGYRNCNGIKSVYIELLYKTGNRFNQYVQLSDLVRDGKATEEQKELNKLLEDIEKGIVSENDFLYHINEYKGKKIADVDLSRLADFLKDIESNKINSYLD